MKGEIAQLTHIGRGLDGNGMLLLDIVVRGYVPSLPRTSQIVLVPFSEDYIQTGQGQWLVAWFGSFSF